MGPLEGMLRTQCATQAVTEIFAMLVAESADVLVGGSSGGHGDLGGASSASQQAMAPPECDRRDTRRAPRRTPEGCMPLALRASTAPAAPVLSVELVLDHADGWD